MEPWQRQRISARSRSAASRASDGAHQLPLFLFLHWCTGERDRAWDVLRWPASIGSIGSAVCSGVRQAKCAPGWPNVSCSPNARYFAKDSKGICFQPPTAATLHQYAATAGGIQASRVALPTPSTLSSILARFFASWEMAHSIWVSFPYATTRFAPALQPLSVGDEALGLDISSNC